MVIGSVVQMTGYVLNSIAPPFPVFIFAYFLGGFGIAIQDAGASGYVSCLNSSTRMGILQSMYGKWRILPSWSCSIGDRYYRSWGVLRTFGFHPVCPDFSLVIPLSCILGAQFDKHDPFGICVPPKETRW